METGSILVYTVLILLASAALCAVAWRLGRSVKLIPRRSRVFPLAIVLALAAATVFAWTSLVDTLSVDSATDWVTVLMMLLPVPVLTLVCAALVAGPIVLGCNLQAVSRGLNTTRPGLSANFFASIGLLLLIGGSIAFARPYFRDLELNREARSPETPMEVLADLAARAARAKDPGLAHHLLQNPMLNDRILTVLVGDCSSNPETEGCRDYMRLLQRHPNAPRQSAAQ